MAQDIFAGLSTHWLRMGDGPREALFLHCSLAHLGAWQGVARGLSSDLSMLMMDLPSHGRTADANAAEDYQTQAVEVALALLKAEARGPVDLVGHSFGATIALRLAQLAPDWVRSLTLIEPVLFAAVRHNAEFSRVESFMRGPFADAMAAGDRIEAARLFNGVWGGATPWERLPDILREDMAARIHLIPASAPVTSEDIHGQAAPGALEALKMPCLLIEGANSPAIIAAIHDVFEMRIPNVRRVVIEGAGHMAPISHPERVAAEILNVQKSALAKNTI